MKLIHNRYKKPSKKLLTVIILLILLNLFLGIYYLTLKTPKPYNSSQSFLIHQCQKVPLRNEPFLNSDRYTCYLNALDTSLKQQGLIETSKVINNYLSSGEDVQFQGACHDFAHTFGETAVSLGYRGSDLLNYCINSCVVGCFHGVGHGYISRKYSFDEINKFCNPADYKGDPLKIAACFHGVGHGIVDVLGSDINQNLKNCSQINTEVGKSECSHGVFMTTSSYMIPAKISLPSDILAFCSNQDKPFQGYCYEFAGFLTYIKSENLAKAGEVCTKVPDKNRNGCFVKFGEIVYISNKTKPPAYLVTPCKDITEDRDKLSCADGISASILADGNKSPEESLLICSSLSSNIVSDCYIKLGDKIAELRGKTLRDNLCSSLSNPYKEACLGT